MADAAFLTLLGYGVMAGRQRNPKSPLIIRSERRDLRSLFVLHDEGGIRERFRTGSVRPDWPSLSWAKRNHSFDPCSRSGLCLPGRKTCSHNQEHQNDWEFSECHYLITLTSSNWVKRFASVLASATGSQASSLTRQVGILPAFLLCRLEACRPGQAGKPIFRLRNLTPQRAQNDLTTDLFRRNFSRSRRFMKRYLPFIIVAVVGLAALGSGAMLYEAKRPHLLTIPEDKTVLGKSNNESMHIRGSPDAPVTVEEFGDFECPPCGNFAGFADTLVKEYDPRLRIIFRNFPLQNHHHAREASLAAEAAGLQGHFWEMHDVLYREQAVWTKASNMRELFESYAGMIGLNLDQFRKDMDGEKARARVDSDRKRGDSLGIQVTPTLFINNRQLDPKDKNPEGIRAVINAALKEKS